MFENLKKLAVVANATREYRIPRTDTVLIVAPATEDNRPYMSAALRAAQEQGRSRKLTLDGIGHNRETDVVLFAAHVIRGWRNVRKDDGTAFDYSPENAKIWLGRLAELAGHVFDELRVFCKDEDNFTDEALHPEGVAKNSLSG